MTESRPDRERFVDFLRVLAVAVVVVGHWLATTVIWEPGLIDGENALSVVPESHLATWVLQVMPLLFFIGGFANSRSLVRFETEYLVFLRARYARLLSPTLVFLGIWVLIGIVAQLLPLPQPNVLEKGADIAALPFWFIGIYVVVVALAPLMWKLHRRFGVRVPVYLGLGAVLIDIAHHGIGIPHIGVANYAFVWLLPHQVGFFYRELVQWDRVRATAMALAGLAGLVLLTSFAGYPTSMIGVPGEDRWNTNPPSVPLLMVALWLIGLALAARPAIERWLTHPGPQRLVSSLNRVPLTLYLWHVSAVTIGASLIYPLGFPRPATGTALWWALRPLWLAVLAAALLVLVKVFGRFEIHPRPERRDLTTGAATRRVGAAFAVTSIGLALLGFGTTGFDRILSSAGEGVLAFTANPAQNVVHLVVGLAALRGALAGRPRAAVVSGLAVYLILGVLGLLDAADSLAINTATSALHLVVFASFLVLLAWALRSDNAAGEAVSAPSPSSRA